MLLHGQATCCDQLHQNEQEKQVHLENINLLAMAENIFLALKGIKPVVSFCWIGMYKDSKQHISS